MPSYIGFDGMAQAMLGKLYVILANDENDGTVTMSNILKGFTASTSFT